MKRSRSIFTQLEKLNRSKYPKFIKTILIETAFNTPAALKAINEKSVEHIEKTVSNNLNLLNKTEYVNATGELKTKPFEFLIGHKALILNFPQEIKDLQSSNEIEKKNKIENLSENDLKALLVLKIINYITNKKITTIKTLNPTENLTQFITNFEKNPDRVRVLVKCPFCVKKIPCTFDTIWRISNFGTHILACSKKTVKRPEIQRARLGVLSEVSANLG